MTDAPGKIIHSSVRIALMVAALNDVEVKSVDILNAYVMAPITENVGTMLGLNFGEDARKITVIVRALHGLKSAGAAFRRHLASCMEPIGCVPCRADPNLWTRPEICQDNKVVYHSYILCYVDDVL